MKLLAGCPEPVEAQMFSLLFSEALEPSGAPYAPQFRLEVSPGMSTIRGVVPGMTLPRISILLDAARKLRQTPSHTGLPRTYHDVVEMGKLRLGEITSHTE